MLYFLMLKKTIIMLENRVPKNEIKEINNLSQPELDLINTVFICYRAGLRKGAKWYRDELKKRCLKIK